MTRPRTAQWTDDCMGATPRFLATPALMNNSAYPNFPCAKSHVSHRFRGSHDVEPLRASLIKRRDAEHDPRRVPNDADTSQAPRRRKSGSPPSGRRTAAAPRGARRLASGVPGRPAARRPGTESGDNSPEGRVVIELTRAQGDQVVRATGEGGTFATLLTSSRGPDWKARMSLGCSEHLEAPRLSRSLLSGLIVLASFESGSDVGIAELAQMLEMNTSTTHRYVVTLLAAGLIERDPATRKYRLAGTR